MSATLRRFAISCCLIAVISSCAALPASGADRFPIIPRPEKIEPGSGSFALNPGTVVVYHTANTDMKGVVDYLTGVLRMSTGYKLPVVDAGHMPRTNYIFFNFIREETLGNEGYVLTTQPGTVDIEANGLAGFMYGAQSLLQILPPDIMSAAPVHRKQWLAPAATITDRPRYAWRGMMLDVCRHFFPKEFVKKYIDYLAFHKMNRFHWHLTDDQGWRIEVKRYPKLTSVGAWRADHEDVHWNARTAQQPGEAATYGGYYTQDDIREVVQYAADRFITIVPEIEMPAHTTAVIAGFPELSCTGGPFTVATGSLWPITDILCAGNDSTFVFIENVLREVAPLFPGEFFHIGGDEANKQEWKRCPKCQARITAEHLKNEEELQSYFTKRIERMLTSIGKRLIGWDEILEGGLPPQATVMSWRGTNGGIYAAREGHDVVMAPTSNCYLDYYQGDRSLEPVGIGGFLPIQTVYLFNPTPDSLTPDQAKHILGTQGNLWTEYIPTPQKAEYMVFPRIAAIAEVGWTRNDLKNWQSFAARLPEQMKRYRAMGVNAAPSAWRVSERDSFDVAGWRRLITLYSQIDSAAIRTSRDGKAPSPSSPSYARPLDIRTTTRIHSAVVTTNGAPGPVSEWVFDVNRKGLTVLTPASAFTDRFKSPGPSGLVDNLRGAINPNDGRWLGISGARPVIDVDLGQVESVHEARVGLFHEPVTPIFLPDSVVAYLSTDGAVWHAVGSTAVTSDRKEQRAFVRDVVVSFPPEKARYLRIATPVANPVPAWHLRSGVQPLVMIDEIFVH